MLEFALIALPLLMLIFGIVEVGLIYWATYELDNNTLGAARMIRTGQVQSGGLTQGAMIAQICNNVSVLSNCATTLQLRVKSFTDFTQAEQFIQSSASSPLNSQGNLSSSFPYQPGGPSTVNLVTAYYTWPLVGISALWPGKLADGSVLLQSSAVFRTEPY